MSDIFMVDDEGMKILEERSFKWEENLQQILQDNPSLLAIEDVKEDIQLATIGREVRFDPGGSADLLFIDQEGVLTLVETKLAKNPEVQREVTGQILEYASSLVGWNFDDLETKYFRYLEKYDTDNNFGSLHEYLSDQFDDFEYNRQELEDEVEDALESGSIRLLIVVDDIVDRLRNLVEFINDYSSFQIIVLQISQYEYEEGVTVYVPKAFGHKSETVTERIKKDWYLDKFLSAAEERLGEDGKNKLEYFYNESNEIADNITWGSGKKGSFNPKFDALQKDSKSLYSVYIQGRVVVNLGWHSDEGPPIKNYENDVKASLDNVKEGKGKVIFNIKDCSEDDIDDFIDRSETLVTKLAEK